MKLSCNWFHDLSYLQYDFHATRQLLETIKKLTTLHETHSVTPTGSKINSCYLFMCCIVKHLLYHLPFVVTAQKTDKVYKFSVIVRCIICILIGCSDCSKRFRDLIVLYMSFKWVAGCFTLSNSHAILIPIFFIFN